jgi:hypothetical protein
MDQKQFRNAAKLEQATLAKQRIMGTEQVHIFPEKTIECLLTGMHWRVPRAQVIATLIKTNGDTNAAFLVSCVSCVFSEPFCFRPCSTNPSASDILTK